MVPLIVKADSGLLCQLESAQPENPFATVGYAAAREDARSEVQILQGDESDPRSWCLAVLRRGRVGCSLEVPSLAFAVDATVEESLHRLAATHRIGLISLETFGSPSAVELTDRQGRRLHTRTEFVLDLTAAPDLVTLCSKSHRERIRKAARSGIDVVRLPSVGAITTLERLHDQSMDRRQARGEDVPRGLMQGGQRLLDLADARVYAAEYQGTVVAAVLVAVSAMGAYTVYSGNSPEGMRVGAAHLLRARLAETMRAEGRRTLNLAGAGLDQEGLADFKRRFGSEERPLAHLSLDTARGWRKWIQRLRR